MAIYRTALKALLTDGKIASDDSILVVCGGDYDKSELVSLGFRDVTISNLDSRYGNLCAPYQWKYLDAEDIEAETGSYDWAIVHMGLHHCASPHRGLNEMMRVARKGVLVMENRESLVMRLAVFLGLTRDYEIETVAIAGNRGGVRDSAVPNFVYRWTEREVRKSVESARPGEVNDIRYFYGLRLPTQRFAMYPRVVRWIASLFMLAVRVVFKPFPRQGNEFAFAVVRTGELKPWVRKDADELAFNPDYRFGFDPAKYKQRDWSKAA